MKICDPHQKRLVSADEGEKVIHGLGQMWSEWDVTLSSFCDFYKSYL